MIETIKVPTTEYERLRALETEHIGHVRIQLRLEALCLAMGAFSQHSTANDIIAAATMFESYLDGGAA